MLYLWFLPIEIRSCQIYLGWYSLVINFFSPRVLPMRRHRIGESQVWKRSVNLSNECRSAVLLMRNWKAEKRLRPGRGRAAPGLHPGENPPHERHRRPLRHGGARIKQLKCRPMLGKCVVISERWGSAYNKVQGTNCKQPWSFLTPFEEPPNLCFTCSHWFTCFALFSPFLRPWVQNRISKESG